MTRQLLRPWSPILVVLGVFLVASPLEARELEYVNSEVSIYVNPGEPTEVQFPAAIQGGYRKNPSALSLEKKDSQLIIFATEQLPDTGEAIILRLKDGRSYSMRIQRADDLNQRDAVVKLLDRRESIISDPSEDPAYAERDYQRAPENSVSGLMREMVLVAEFGKTKIAGYKVSERYKGDTVLSDGTLHAKIDRIFIGPSLWGYVIDVENLLDQTQRVNPATFRLDGTRAVSAKEWELAPRPLNIEHQIADKHNTKIYVITRARRANRS